MQDSPVLNLSSLNPNLYRESRDLHQVHIYRLQLYHARAYVTTCSRSKPYVMTNHIKLKALTTILYYREQSLLGENPSHWYTDAHIYSLDDLISVKNKTLIPRIKHLTSSCIQHISNCPVSIFFI